VSGTGRRLTAVCRRSAGSARAEWELPYGPTAARQARHALEGWLDSVGIDPADGPGPDIVLAASELAANAGLHGLPPIVLEARLTGDGDDQLVAVSVSDSSSQQPRSAVVSPVAEHGRGLGIVDALARRWGSRQTSDGKAMWFEIAVPTPARSTSGARGTYHNGPFEMDDERCPGATRSGALAS
jgi:anti-sigma regulatory factor (Ser/Thr protein kinase)